MTETRCSKHCHFVLGLMTSLSFRFLGPRSDDYESFGETRDPEAGATDEDLPEALNIRSRPVMNDVEDYQCCRL